MKTGLSVLLRKTIRFLLRVFFVFPIDPQLVLIDSMWGKGVSDNAKYYLQWAREYSDNGLRYVWGVKDPAGQEPIPGVTFVKYRSLRWFRVHAVAKVILYSHHLYNYMPMRAGQYHILMWHAGGAYKRIGSSVAGNSPKDVRLHQARNQIVNDPGVIFLSSSEIFTRYNIQEVYGFRGRIENTGMPRNDLFFDPERVRVADGKVRKQLGIRENACVMLYAPTFRMAALKTGGSTETLDFNRLLESLQEKDPVILYRCHYYEKSELEQNQRIIDVSDYPDMQELLCCANLLVTDYSSCIWDYSFLGRPCFLFVPDLEDYKNREQGFFTPIESWPGEICRDMEALCGAVKTKAPACFAEKAERHHREAGSYEEGKACEKLGRLIQELTERK